MKKDKKNMCKRISLCYTYTLKRGVLMKKINITLKINDYELKTDGFINNEIISFKDKDEKSTEIIFDLKSNTLIRENDEILIKIYFDKPKENIEYLLKKENLTFYNEFSNLRLLKKERNIIISYRIEKADFNMILNYEEVKL